MVDLIDFLTHCDDARDDQPCSGWNGDEVGRRNLTADAYNTGSKFELLTVEVKGEDLLDGKGVRSLRL